MNCIHRVLISSCLALAINAGLAQQVIVNSNGDRVIMYPDGSWRPVAPSDSLLIRQYQISQQESDKATDNTGVLNEGEEQNS